jgi:hypothetical protein
LSPILDNLEPLEALTGLSPEQGLEGAAAWNDELVASRFKNSKTSFLKMSLRDRIRLR